jgi:hypothetical protein
MARLKTIVARSGSAALASILAICGLVAGQDFRVEPFLQNPASDAITIRWLSESGDPGLVVIDGRQFTSDQ